MACHHLALMHFQLCFTFSCQKCCANANTALTRSLAPPTSWHRHPGWHRTPHDGTFYSSLVQIYTTLIQSRPSLIPVLDSAHGRCSDISHNALLCSDSRSCSERRGLHRGILGNCAPGSDPVMERSSLTRSRCQATFRLYLFHRSVSAQEVCNKSAGSMLMASARRFVISARAAFRNPFRFIRINPDLRAVSGV